MKVKRLLKRLFGCCCKVRGCWILGPIIIKVKGQTTVDIILTDEQILPLAVNWKTQAGNPAAVENEVFTSSAPEVADVRMLDLDGSGVMKPYLWTNTLGATQVTVKADALIGEGEVLIELPPLNVTVKAALADPAASTWAPGGPVLKPPPAPVP